MSNYKDHWTDEYVADLKMQLEEKDKEIEWLNQRIVFKDEIENQLQVRIEQDINKLESKDRELAQLKEIADKMAVRLEHYVNEEDELLTKYAKWTSA